MNVFQNAYKKIEDENNWGMLAEAPKVVAITEMLGCLRNCFILDKDLTKRSTSSFQYVKNPKFELARYCNHSSLLVL
jgi:hypothetical protein